MKKAGWKAWTQFFGTLLWFIWWILSLGVSVFVDA